ncbi:DUF1015 domain-containing protein [Myxococcota bacterium]|nr:DUF1015 domain-containing protein [Myxococcota bacterium]
MTVVRPFRAVHYAPDRVDLSKVMVPPYDVVAADERGSFFDRDPHNAIRFELTRDVKDEAGADYSEMAQTLEAWLKDGVLVQDEQPGFYVMKQRFTAPDGAILERIGFFGELALAEYDERVVLPHERTLAGPKADRLRLLRAAKANLSSVFMLYEDRENELASILSSAFGAGGEILGTARDGAGVEYELARLTDPDGILKLKDFMSTRSCVIADGHHRYETALEYRREQREAAGRVEDHAPFESTLAFFANAYAPGSLLLPIHRVVLRGEVPSEAVWREKLPGWSCRSIELSSTEEAADRATAELADQAGHPAFVADSGDDSLWLFWREEPLGDELMVRILERDVMGGVFGLSVDDIRGGAVSFPKSAARAAQEVREGEGQVALYLNPLSPDDVFRVTGQGEVMPQKSTFFYPKIPTGMVFRVHRDSP